MPNMIYWSTGSYLNEYEQIPHNYQSKCSYIGYDALEQLDDAVFDDCGAGCGRRALDRAALRGLLVARLHGGLARRADGALRGGRCGRRDQLLAAPAGRRRAHRLGAQAILL